MTLATLKTMTDDVKARTGVDVTTLKASDLFNPDLASEVKDVLRKDLLRRDCKQAK